MSNLPSVKQKIQTESTRYLSSVSEFLVQTIGKSINWLIDHVDGLENEVSGLFLGDSILDHGALSYDTQYWSYTAPAGKYLIAILHVAGTRGLEVSCTGFMKKNDNNFTTITSDSPVLPAMYFIRLAPGQNVSIDSSGGPGGISSRTLIGCLNANGTFIV